MRTIHSRNVNEALLIALQALEADGKLRDSRNGPVKVFDTPVSTLYTHPDERVMFYPERDANPFFHFMEGLWMLAGRNDVEWISRFNSAISNYSDDGVTFHGAYGHRWRSAETIIRRDDAYELASLDQFQTVAKILRENPDDRRAVMQMWNADMDLGKEGKDFPCNLICTFRINDGKLDMTVFNRSNDIIWGAYGANAVHFSMMQEVMAATIGVPLGRYWQVSTNFHGYVSTLDKHADLNKLSPGFDEYTLGEVVPYPMVNGPIDIWFQDLEMFMSEGPVMGFRDPFFRKVASPIYSAWIAWKDRDNPLYKENAINALQNCQADDWQRACVEWIERRS